MAACQQYRVKQKPNFAQQTAFNMTIIISIHMGKFKIEERRRHYPVGYGVVKSERKSFDVVTMVTFMLYFLSLQYTYPTALFEYTKLQLGCFIQCSLLACIFVNSARL